MGYWRRGPDRQGWCGGCDREIPPGALIYLITIAGVTRGLVRCQPCGEARAPRLRLVERQLPPLMDDDMVITI